MHTLETMDSLMLAGEKLGSAMHVGVLLILTPPPGADIGNYVDGLYRDGLQRRPVLVERASLAILDGHHRFRAMQRLGLASINAVLIDYDDPRLTLSSWSARDYTRDEVRAAAASGALLPAKSTRHVLDPPLADMPVPLSDLATA